jgi:hypothetical protein
VVESRKLLWTGAENLGSTGVRSKDRPAHSKSLYRIHYPGPYRGVEKTTRGAVGCVLVTKYYSSDQTWHIGRGPYGVLVGKHDGRRTRGRPRRREEDNI